MPVEKSAGAVIFRRDYNPPTVSSRKLAPEGEIFYLLLHYPSSSKSSREYWDLPKGHIEKGEKMEETVKREVAEETGLNDIELTEGFKEGIRYFFKFEGKNIMKFVTFYLAETKTKEIRISDEHLGYEWLHFEKALEKLTFKNAKEILKKANTFLSRKSI